DDQVDALVPAQVADDFSVHPRDGLEFSRPVATVVRPGQPSRGVGLPFGGHAIAKSRRRRLHLAGIVGMARTAPKQRLGELCSPWTGRRPVPTRSYPSIA